MKRIQRPLWKRGRKLKQNINIEIDEPRNPAINIDLKFDKKYGELANPQSKSGKDKEKVLFERMVDLFMFALIHGFKKNLHKPITGSSKKDIFKWSNFKEEDKVIIRSICLLHNLKHKKEDPTILQSKSDMIEIIESYANGGFHDFVSKIDMPDFEGNLIELLASEMEDSSEDKE